MKHNVLIVDDVAANLETLEGTLHEYFKSINIICANSGNEALSILLKNDIDLIISDIQMPQMDGFELYKLVKTNKKISDIPFIFITAILDEDTYIARGYELGAIDYITKPINDSILRPKLRTYLENIQLQKDLQKKLEIIRKQNEIVIKQNERIEEQSRFASMGEMISMIAHQWRQPLTRLSGYSSVIQLKKTMGMLEDKDLDELFLKQDRQVKYMTETIEDFLGFFKDTSIGEFVSIENLLNSSIRLIDDGYISCGAKIDIKYINMDGTFTIKTKISKFNQVMLNLLKNTLDEFKSQKKQYGKMTITVTKYEDNITFDISDNAGGIPENILPQIWDAYFSTKDKNGTGIGLYMTKILVERHLEGTIKAFNADDGAVFRITVPLN